MKMLRMLIMSLMAIPLVVSLAASQERVRVPDSVLNSALKGLGEGNKGNSAIWPYYIKLISDPENLIPGEARLMFIYSPNTECSDFRITISKIENLKIIGDHVLQSSATKDDTVTLSLHVEIPSNDASGFKYELDYCGQKQEWYSYFLAGETTVRWTSENLSKAARTASKRQRPESPYMRFVRPQVYSDTGIQYVTIYSDSDLNFQIPIDTFNAWKNQATDTALERRIDSLRKVTENYLKQAEQAKELRYELSKQIIDREEYILQRFLETKDSGLDWRIQKGLTTEEIIKRNAAIHAERMRSDTTQFREVILDLRDPKDYENITSRRGLKLEPQEEAGFYKVRLSIEILYDLTDQGIKILRPRNKENQDNRPVDQSESENTESDPDGKTESSEVAGIIWDIYDSQNDDFSDSTNWGDTTLPYNSNVDSIGDTLSLGPLQFWMHYLETQQLAINLITSMSFGKPGFSHRHLAICAV